MAGMVSTTEGRNPQRNRPLTLGIIALLGGLAAIGMLSTNIMLPAFPELARAFGVPVSALGVVLSSFFIVLAVGQLIAGPVSDHYGRKWLVMGGLLVFLVGTLLCFLAQSLEALVAGRVVQAIGISAGPVLSRAVARDLFDGEALTRVLALTMIAIAAAPGFSPLLGGIIVSAIGWRWLFAFVALIAVIIGISFAIVIGETHRPQARARFSLISVMRGYGRLAVDQRFLLPALAVSFIFGGLYAFFATAPAILITAMKLTPVDYGLFSAATVFIVFGAAIAAPRLARRFDANLIAGLGAVCAIASGIILLPGSDEPGLTLYTASIALLLFGMGLVTPLASAMSLMPFETQAGLASSLLGFLQMGSAAGVTALTTKLELPPVTTLLAFEILGGSLTVLCLVLNARRNRVRLKTRRHAVE